MIKKERNCFDMKIEIYLNLCVVSKEYSHQNWRIC